MKETIKIILIYFLLQILGSFSVVPFVMGYLYFTTGSTDYQQYQQAMLPYSLVMGMVFMGIYLWKSGKLSSKYHLWKSLEPKTLGITVLWGCASLIVISLAVELTSPDLPDLMESQFRIIMGNFAGLIGVTFLGPILEELIFRGVITRVLLEKYPPMVSILVAGLCFGLIHLNPAQVVPGILSGIMFSWLYYITRSLLPGIIVHIINNSYATFLTLNFPEIKNAGQLMPLPALIATGVVALAISVWGVFYLKRRQYTF